MLTCCVLISHCALSHSETMKRNALIVLIAAVDFTVTAFPLLGNFDGSSIIKGDKGDKGDQGDKGDRGDQGDSGPAGPVGPAGAAGATFTIDGVGSGTEIEVVKAIICSSLITPKPTDRSASIEGAQSFPGFPNLENANTKWNYKITPKNPCKTSYKSAFCSLKYPLCSTHPGSPSVWYTVPREFDPVGSSQNLTDTRH